MTNGEAVIAELISEVASLRAQLTEEAAKHALTTQHSDLLGAQLASARKALDLAEYVSRKDSLTEHERLSSVRTVVCAAISALTDEKGES